MPAKERIGTVVSNKMQKTIVVAVQSRYQSYLYSKSILQLQYNIDIKEYYSEKINYPKVSSHQINQIIEQKVK